MAERHAPGLPNALAVRPTMGNRCEHQVDCTSIRLATIVPPNANQSTHVRLKSFALVRKIAP
jgi:hypothetical protein